MSYMKQLKADIEQQALVYIMNGVEEVTPSMINADATDEMKIQVIEEMKEYYHKQQNCNHQFVDTSIAGPESGTLGYECKKCGFGHEETLY